MEEQTEKRVKSEVNLRKLMRKMGLGTNAFAKACGVSSQAMAQYLRPGKSLTTATIYKIASTLDIDPREMFFPTEEDEEKKEGGSNYFQNGNNCENGVEAQNTPDSKKEETQDAKEMLYCPHCGTKFFVVNVPNS